MNENKRFTLDDENDDIIFDNNSITDSGVKELYWLIDCDQRQKLVDLLNEQDMEIQLLKKQMMRLYNYFMDWHSDEMGGNQFSEMWDMVKESEYWELEF